VCASRKITKYQKPSEEKMGAGPQTSLKISSSGADVLWLVGPDDRRGDFSNGHAEHWKFKGREVQVTFLFDAKRLRTREMGWPRRRCQTSAKVDKLAEKSLWQKHGRRLWKDIKVIFTLIGKQNCLGYEILNIETRRVKLKKRHSFHGKIVEQVRVIS